MLTGNIRFFILFCHLQTGAMSLSHRCMCLRGGSNFAAMSLHSSVSRLSAPSISALQSATEEIPVETSTPSYLDQKPTDKEISSLYSFLREKKNVLVISGAGISTSSGVPDYRGPLGSYKLGPKKHYNPDMLTQLQ